ncbi:MAG: PQQ-binding-like beta-propeller repeat protein [Pirellulaceae bacterium]
MRKINSWILAAIAVHAGIAQADWPGFLGPGGNAVVDDRLPLTFAAAKDDQPAVNIAWRTELPGRSVSGPIVVDGKVITTSSSAMEGRWMHVSAVDAETGEVVWLRSTKATGRPYCHPLSANAAPTPCTDGRQIYAFFSSNDLVCYDVDGNLQWFRSLTDQHPLAGNDVGMSSSPIVVDGVVVVTVECQADSFTAGIDSATGETKWEISRPRKANWSSPRVATGHDRQPVVVMHSMQDLVGINPQSGKVAWTVKLPCSSTTTSVFANGKIYVPSGGVKVFELPQAMQEPKPLWESSRANPSSASLLVSPLGVLTLNRSVLVCCDEQGELKWQTRLPDAGQFWATPVIAGETMYAFALNGKCFVVKLSEEGGEVLEECELGAEVLGSPAISDGAMFVRATDALWKISE